MNGCALVGGVWRDKEEQAKRVKRRDRGESRMNVGGQICNTAQREENINSVVDEVKLTCLMSGM